MARQRVRISCPNCTHPLHVRVEDLGRKGECKYCGHRFRPVAALPPLGPDDRVSAGGVAKSACGGGSEGRGATPGYPTGAENVGQWVHTIERGLERSGTRLTPEQRGLLEQVMVTLGETIAQPQPWPGVAGRGHDGASATPAPGSRSGTGANASVWVNRAKALAEESESGIETDENDRVEIRLDDPPFPVRASASASAPGPEKPLAAPAQHTQTVRTEPAGRFELVGAGTDSFEFAGEMPVATRSAILPATDVVECVNRLVHERDEARGQCARLEDEAILLRSLLAERSSEAARLRKSADRLQAVRAERDRLNSERTMLAREATQVHARMVETQVALVEVEAELEECRERLAAEREAWQRERGELVAEAERQRAALRSRVEAELRAAERTHLAESDALGGTLEDVECRLETGIRDEDEELAAHH